MVVGRLRVDEGDALLCRGRLLEDLRPVAADHDPALARDSDHEVAVQHAGSPLGRGWSGPFGVVERVLLLLLSLLTLLLLLLLLLSSLSCPRSRR